MSDLIDRQQALEIKFSNAIVRRCAVYVRMDELVNKLNALPSAQPEIPPYVAEIEAEYKKWINVPYIRKPLAKALCEVWKKYDREDVERRTE